MRILLTILAWLIIGTAFPQEILTGLQINPVVMEQALRETHEKYLKSGTDTLPMTLPFFDDFSKPAVFPSSERWIDR